MIHNYRISIPSCKVQSVGNEFTGSYNTHVHVVQLRLSFELQLCVGFRPLLG